MRLKARASSASWSMMGWACPMLLGLPTWGRGTETRQHRPGHCRFRLLERLLCTAWLKIACSRANPKAHLPGPHLDVPASEHHRVHLLQGKLRGLWDLILHKGKALGIGMCHETNRPQGGEGGGWGGAD